MSTTFASRTWPAPAQPAAASAWRFARQLDPQRDGVDRAALQWSMPRHGSFVPGQLLGVYLALGTLALAIGAAFWWLGAPAVLPFAGAELLLLAGAFGWISRHAGDAETITLAERVLQVEHRFGRLVERAQFRAEWVRVEPAHGDGSLIELTGQGRHMRVGRYLRPELRSTLAQELSLALRRAATPATAVEMLLGPQR